MNRFIIVAAAICLAGPALAGNHTQGIEKSDGVALEATERGTLHPGHVAVFATPAEKYNKPAAEFHLTEDGYEGGPGGWAATRGKKD